MTRSHICYCQSVLPFAVRFQNRLDNFLKLKLRSHEENGLFCFSQGWCAKSSQTVRKICIPIPDSEFTPVPFVVADTGIQPVRSEERRVGKECRWRSCA